MEDNGVTGEHTPPEPVFEVPPPQEIKVLETVEDIQVNEGFFCISKKCRSGWV